MAFPTRVIPVKFSQQVKSEVSWRYLAIIETGPLCDCSGERASHITHVNPTRGGRPHRPGVLAVRHLPGRDPPRSHQNPALVVPEGDRGPDSELIHDDCPLADTLVAVLAWLDWSVNTEAGIVEAPDPSLFMERDF